MLKPHEGFYIAIITHKNKKEKLIFKGSEIGAKDYSSQRTVNELIRREIRKLDKPNYEITQIREAYYLEIEDLYNPNY